MFYIVYLLYSLSICTFSDIIIERFTPSKNISWNSEDLIHIRKKRQPDDSPAANVSFLLNSILKDYDKTFRPNFNKNRPTIVNIDIFVRTMGPISELTDTYAFDCYFRQSWRDDRLRYSNDMGTSRNLSLAMAMLEKIWKPDTYFWNGAGSYIHMLTSPNRLVRLYGDGTVLYSSRLTVKAKCRMQLNRYPLDKQACRLIVGSFAYKANEVKFQWGATDEHDGVQIDYAAITQLPQFGVVGFEVFNTTNRTRDSDYSSLEVRFYLDRHFGYFLMNFYVPCTLIVLLCWVAFWINREATNDRLGLGITSVLTMTFLSIDSRTDSPKVDLPTALDVYIWICYFFLFGCIIEFTVVHYHTKYNTGDPEIQEIERRKMREMIRSIPRKAVMSSRAYTRPGMERPPQVQPMTLQNGFVRRNISVAGPPPIIRRDGGRYSVYNKKKSTVTMHKTLHQSGSNEYRAPSQTLEEFRTDNVGWRLYYWVMDHQRRTDPLGIRENSMSAVDRFARITLPIAFGVVVILYYNFYINTPHEFLFEDVHYVP